VAADELSLTPGPATGAAAAGSLSLGGAARLLGGLKLRLLANGFRIGWQVAVGIVAGAVVTLPPALLGGVVLALLPRRAPDTAELLLPAVALLLFAGWTLGPILAFGTDETLDPSRLALLPLRPAQLMAGLFAASSIGIAPTATLLLVAGMAAGVAPAGPAALVAVAAAAGLFLLCVAAGRALTTGLSSLLRTRRVRDLSIMLVVLVSMTVGVGAQFVVHLGSIAGEGFANSLDTAADVLMYTPPGLAGRAMLAARDGDWPAGLASLGGLAASIVALVWVWWRNLSRLATRPEAPAASRRARRPAGLFGGALGPLPRSPAGATAAAQLRLLGRDPRTRAAYLGMLVTGAMIVAASIVIPRADNPKLIFAVLFIAWLGSVGALNQYGYDGRAYWMVAVSGADPAADLAGRNAALIVVDLMIMVLVTVVLSVLTGGWLYGLAVVSLSVAVLGAMVAAGNLTSVLVPQPQPEATGNLWSLNSTGGGFTAGLGQMAALAASAVLLLPLGAATAVGLAVWPPALAVAAVVAPPYGLLLLWLGRRIAARWVRAHQPELLASLNPRRNG
jgi:ABC-2 type transport system permease protein